MEESNALQLAPTGWDSGILRENQLIRSKFHAVVEGKEISLTVHRVAAADDFKFTLAKTAAELRPLLALNCFLSRRRQSGEFLRVARAAAGDSGEEDAEGRADSGRAFDTH